MSSKLLPCPFCGFRNAEGFEGAANKFWVQCLDCSACGPECETYGAAESFWNVRAWQFHDEGKGAGR